MRRRPDVPRMRPRCASPRQVAGSSRCQPVQPRSRLREQISSRGMAWTGSPRASWPLEMVSHTDSNRHQHREFAEVVPAPTGRPRPTRGHLDDQQVTRRWPSLHRSLSPRSPRDPDRVRGCQHSRDPGINSEIPLSPTWRVVPRRSRGARPPIRSKNPDCRQDVSGGNGRLVARRTIGNRTVAVNDGSEAGAAVS